MAKVSDALFPECRAVLLSGQAGSGNLFQTFEAKESSLQITYQAGSSQRYPRISNMLIDRLHL